MVGIKQVIIAIISIILVSLPLPVVAESGSAIAKPKEPVASTAIKPKLAPKQQVTPVVEKTVEQPKESSEPIVDCDDWMIQAGIADLTSARELIRRESNCNIYATNPSSGAYGIPQSLPAGKMASAGSDWATNPVTQLKWMQSYVLGRYGSFAAALAFHSTHHWY